MIDYATSCHAMVERMAVVRPQLLHHQKKALDDRGPAPSLVARGPPQSWDRVYCTRHSRRPSRASALDEEVGGRQLLREKPLEVARGAVDELAA